MFRKILITGSLGGVLLSSVHSEGIQVEMSRKRSGCFSVANTMIVCLSSGSGDVCHNVTRAPLGLHIPEKLLTGPQAFSKQLQFGCGMISSPLCTAAPCHTLIGSAPLRSGSSTDGLVSSTPVALIAPEE